MKNFVSRCLNNERRLAYTIILPGFLLLWLFAYLPALQSLRFSFMRYNIKMPHAIKFRGLYNYHNVLSDPVFWQSVGRVLFFMALSSMLVMTIALGMALVLHQKFPGRGLLRTLVILPWAIPPVVNGFLWKWILNGEYGALNGLLYQLGMIRDYQFWMANSLAALTFAVLTFVWRYAPFITILYLGVLQSIPSDLYEQATVDGAGLLKRFWYITLPMLSKVGGIALILTLIAAFTVFDDIVTLTGSYPTFYEATKTPMINNYEVTFGMGRFGRGAAMAYLIGILLFGLTSFYIRLSLKNEE
ncbi:ABC transporter permease [candidate division KSB3 bacterium]|uniref:ABC transporter permease n=1 Tax=candidate division KSB3 bacterium TaxID=2044937 RepID=A0A2G6E3G3_9BACT|nr:MAG: ABC transporter permease [candidate division KSB3 bacterium]PIE29101.1 MAG: ABC transporter permease [candidate division KSB3 bacterium]